MAYWIRRGRQAATPLTLVQLAVQRASVNSELLLQHASDWQLALPDGVDAIWLAGLLGCWVAAEDGLMLTPQQEWLVVEPVDMGKGDLFATDRPLLAACCLSPQTASGRLRPVTTGSSRAPLTSNGRHG